MRVLSLFDGMACARLTLHNLGIPVTKYYASEVDKYAIAVAKANWPDIVHIGDVTQVIGAQFIEPIDLLCGGSPCQGFSFAGKQLNFEDPRSKLFWEFVRLKNELQPKFFFLENVNMAKQHQKVITEALGVEPILLNSALVCAQNRKRLYWTNIPFFGMPEDRGIVLKDILETNFLNKQDDKSLCLSAGYRHNPSLRDYNKSRKQLITVEQTGVIQNKNKIEVRNDKAMCLDANYLKGADNHGQRTIIRLGNVNPSSSSGMNGRVYGIDGKSATLTANKGEGQKIGIIQVGNIYESNGVAGRIYSENGKSPALMTASSGGNKMPKVAEDVYLNEEQIQRGFHQAEAKVWNTGNKMGKMDVPNNPDKKAKTLTTVQTAGGRETNHIKENNLTYRKLTVTECERLQGVPDFYTRPTEVLIEQALSFIVNKKEKHLKNFKYISNSQAYKMLGNGWQVDTIMHLFQGLKDHDLL